MWASAILVGPGLHSLSTVHSIAQYCRDNSNSFVGPAHCTGQPGPIASSCFLGGVLLKDQTRYRLFGLMWASAILVGPGLHSLSTVHSIAQYCRDNSNSFVGPAHCTGQPGPIASSCFLGGVLLKDQTRCSWNAGSMDRPDGSHHLATAAASLPLHPCLAHCQRAVQL